LAVGWENCLSSVGERFHLQGPQLLFLRTRYLAVENAGKEGNLNLRGKKELASLRERKK